MVAVESFSKVCFSRSPTWVLFPPIVRRIAATVTVVSGTWRKLCLRKVPISGLQTYAIFTDCARMGLDDSDLLNLSPAYYGFPIPNEGARLIRFFVFLSLWWVNYHMGYLRTEY